MPSPVTNDSLGNLDVNALDDTKCQSGSSPDSHSEHKSNERAGGMVGTEELNGLGEGDR